MKRNILRLAIACAAFAALPSMAQVSSAFGNIVYIGSGWNTDSMYVKTTATFVQTTNCGNQDFYQTDPASADNLVHQSMILTALLANKQILVTVNGCYGGRPKIIGIQVLN